MRRNRNVQAGYKLLKTATVADSAPLLYTDLDQLPSGYVPISASGTTLKLMAFGTGVVNGTVINQVYGGHGFPDVQQPSNFLGTIQWTLGTMQCNNDPTDPELSALSSHFYFDKAAVLSEGGMVDVRLGNDQETNRIGLAIFRLEGLSWLLLQCSLLTNITKISIIGTWVNETLPEA